MYEDIKAHSTNIWKLQVKYDYISLFEFCFYVFNGEQVNETCDIGVYNVHINVNLGQYTIITYICVSHVLHCDRSQYVRRGEIHNSCFLITTVAKLNSGIVTTFRKHFVIEKPKVRKFSFCDKNDECARGLGEGEGLAQPRKSHKDVGKGFSFPLLIFPGQRNEY